MRDYHRKSCGISRGAYYQIKGILMDYDRLKKERLDVLYGAQYTINGMPHGDDVRDVTAQKAGKLSYINAHLEAIDQSAVVMRGEYSDAVEAAFDPIKAYWSYDYFNCQHKRTEKHPNGPCRRTWNNYKDKFSALIAQRLNIF